MLFSSTKKIRLGYIIAFILLLFSYSLIFYSTSRLRKSTEWVSHTHIVIAKIESIKAAIAEAETGARGYILTKDEKFLTPYTNSLQSLPVYYNDLRKLVSDNTSQQLRLDTIDQLVKKRLALFAYGLNIFHDSGYVITSSMETNWQESRITTDSIRFYVNAMKDTEEELLKKRTSKLSGLSGNIQGLIIVSLVTAILAIGYSLLLYKNERRAKNEFDRKANQYRTELEETVRKLKAINEELTELKSIEKFAATGRVARTIAHEVRNPLTNISLASEQLQSLNPENIESSVLLDMITRNTVRINQLVSDLLNATKSVQLDLQKIKMQQLLNDTLALANDRIDLNHIKLEKNYTADCKIEVDVEKIKLAFLNIFVNAIEAMEKNNGLLQITVRNEGQKCIVEISDNGKGMDEETLQRIFEPYFTNKLKGNGLGLTITQNIILSHRGTIKVQSQPGKGTVFTIQLDIAY